MDHRTNPKTGDKLSLLGLGLMRLPLAGSEMADIDTQKAEAIVEACIRGGVNYFDTAYNYHDKNSELFAGRALSAHPRGSYHLATKLPIWLVDSLDKAKELFARQLKNCQTDYFDYYLVHAMDEEDNAVFEKYGLWAWLEDMRRDGRVRHIGFSSHNTPEVLERFLAQHPWDFVQLQINYVDWDFQDAAAQYALTEQYQLPCIVMEPVRGGRLATLGPEADALLKAHSPTASTASWALRFAAALPNVITVLSGMSTLQQVQDNLATFSPLRPLSDEEKALLFKAGDIFKAQNAIPCTNCAYCMPCPQDVDIPGMLAVANACALDSSTFRFKGRYAEFPQQHNAGHCIACGQCEAACPQHIPIMQHMQKMAKDAAE
ncbi:MAG: aldo/keto reductase [Oscillospiraceae bacterium]